LRRFALVAAIAAAVVPTVPAAEAHACADADARPASVTAAELRDATVCLLNRERRARGRVALRQNDGLALAGQRHARDMVGRRYFAHDSRSGEDFSRRIRRTGYLRGSGGAVLGENLAWGGSGLATPRRIVRMWMNSPGHRANVLRPRFREVGIGIVRSTPLHGRDGATYAAEFGARL
jgi:uncharacterized protein YkwD